ncbi:MAG: 4'-phosphopantetheinyl transferase superfamily protein [Vicingaceae bacterium]|nr:4'-phosphopantetheinyl transferase superfamily protein [Vicingaceae bacterium]
MPLILNQKSTDNESILAVWKITESIDELRNLLKSFTAIQPLLKKTSNESLIKQQLAIRILIFNFFNPYNLIYDEKGKPFLNNGYSISISHSNEYAVILLDKKNPCGVDIEKISLKVERIKHKFLSKKELAIVSKSNNDLELLTIMWCAKETLYKYYGKKEVIFDKHLSLQLNPTNLSCLKGEIAIGDFYQQLNLATEKIDDFMLVYTKNKV